MFDQAIVHIGLTKTASTTLQAQAVASSQVLSDELDVYYPTLSKDPQGRSIGNHSFDLASMFPRGELTNDALELRASYAGNFEQTDASVLFFSGEGVASFERNQIGDLNSWLRSFANNVLFVAVVRHPLERAASVTQQNLRRGGTFETTSQFLENRGTWKQLEAFRLTLSKDALLLLDFADIVSEGTVLGQFLARTNPRWVEADLCATLGASRDRFAESMPHQIAYLLNALNLQRRLDWDNVGALRFKDDFSKFYRLSGTKFRPPIALFEIFSSHVDQELAYLQDHFLMTPKATRQVVFGEEPNPDAEWLRAVSIEMSDSVNYVELNRLYERHLSVHNDKPESIQVPTSMSIEIARLLGRATLDELEKEPTIVASLLRQIERTSLYQQYRMAIFDHAKRVDTQ